MKSMDANFRVIRQNSHGVFPLTRQLPVAEWRHYHNLPTKRPKTQREVVEIWRVEWSRVIAIALNAAVWVMLFAAVARWVA